MQDRFDAYITVKGSGVAGQAGAVRLGVSRALIQYDEGTAAQPVEGAGALVFVKRYVKQAM